MKQVTKTKFEDRDIRDCIQQFDDEYGVFPKWINTTGNLIRCGTSDEIQGVRKNEWYLYGIPLYEGD